MLRLRCWKCSFCMKHFMHQSVGRFVGWLVGWLVGWFGYGCGTNRLSILCSSFMVISNWYLILLIHLHPVVSWPLEFYLNFPSKVFHPKSNPLYFELIVDSTEFIFWLIYPAVIINMSVLHIHVKSKISQEMLWKTSCWVELPHATVNLQHP